MPRASPAQKHLNAVLTTPRDAGSCRRRSWEDADFDDSGGYVDAHMVKKNESVTSKRPSSEPQQDPTACAAARLTLSSRNDFAADHSMRKGDKHFVDWNRLAHLLNEEKCALRVRMPCGMKMPMSKSKV